MARGNTTNSYHSRHSIPKNLVGLVNDLRLHEGITHVGLGKFHFDARERGSRIEIRGGEKATRLVKAVAYHEGSAMWLFLTIKKGSDYLPEVAKFLTNYYDNS